MDESTIDQLMQLVSEQEQITALHIGGQGPGGVPMLDRTLDQINHDSQQQLQQLGGSVNPAV